MQRPVVFVLAAASVGGILGSLFGAVVLESSGLSLIPWALAGVGVGAFGGSRGRAVGGGAAYGFVLAYVFMISEYDGSAPLHTKLAPFLVFGVVGAVCGVVLAVLGFTVRRRTSKA